MRVNRKFIRIEKVQRRTGAQNLSARFLFCNLWLQHRAFIRLIHQRGIARHDAKWARIFALNVDLPI